MLGGYLHIFLFLQFSREKIVEWCEIGIACLRKEKLRRPVHTLSWRKLQTEFSLWKSITCCPSTSLCPPNYGKRSNQRSFWIHFRLKKTREATSTDYRNADFFKKLSFQTVFMFTLKRKVGVFKFLRFEERLHKARFSVRISACGL